MYNSLKVEEELSINEPHSELGNIFGNKKTAPIKIPYSAKLTLIDEGGK